MKIDINNILPRLAPPEKEEEYIRKGIVYERVADLLLSYYKPVHEIALIPITKDLMEESGFTKDDLKRRAEGLGKDEVIMMPMLNMLRALGYDHEEPEEGPEMCVLTNRTKNSGAGVIVSNEARQRIEEVFGRNAILLPSSIHEFIIVRNNIDISDLIQAVREINRTVLAEGDFLSDNVYRLSSSGGLVIANDIERILDLI